jgi:hypothetical protein
MVENLVKKPSDVEIDEVIKRSDNNYIRVQIVSISSRLMLFKLD